MPQTTDSALAERLAEVFGAPDDPMDAVEERARRLLPGHHAIVWEGDAATFQFGYVGRAAETVLGYPTSRWTEEPSFWADVVVHPEDRDTAVAYCALCTGKGQDHDFEYRARTADGRDLRLHDVVRVIKGDKGIATRLRGVMLDVSDEPAASATT
jgi:PAS domain-containing protein